MDTLLFSFNAVAPILATLLLGMLLRRWGLMPEGVTNGINKLCFTLLIPVNLFAQLYDADLRQGIDLPFTAFGLGVILVTFALLWVLVPRFIQDGVQRGEFIQGTFRSSISVIGISLLANLYGPGGILCMSLLLPLSVVLNNALAVVELGYFMGGSKKPSARVLLRGVVTNPLIIASVLGLLFALSPLKMPTFLGSTVKSVSNAATAMSLIALGAGITVDETFRGLRLATISALIREFLIPLLVLPLAVLVGIRGAQLGGILSLVCAPTATVGYVLSRNMGGDGKLFTQILILTTAFSFVSMFAAIAILQGAGFL